MSEIFSTIIIIGYAYDRYLLQGPLIYDYYYYN